MISEQKTTDHRPSAPDRTTVVRLWFAITLLASVVLFWLYTPIGAQPGANCSASFFVDQTFPYGVRDGVQLRPGQRQEIGSKVEEGGKGDRLHRPQQLGGDHRGNRICRVVETVQKVERQREDDQPDQQRQGELVHAARLSCDR